MSENLLKGVLEIAGGIIKTRRERRLEKEVSKIEKQKEKSQIISEIKTEINKIKMDSELKELKTDILEKGEEKEKLKEHEAVKKYLDKELKKYKSPLTSEMVFSAAKEFNVPVEYMMAIMKNDSHYGTRGKGAKTFNPGNVGNTDNGSTRNLGNRTDGVRAVARNLARRIKEYKNVYGEDKNPSIKELVTNQGPDKKGFIANQANYKKPNQKRFGGYMTAEKGPDNVEKISNQLAQNIEKEISLVV